MSQNLGTNARTENIEVTVIKAQDLPPLKSKSFLLFEKDRKFYVTVDNGTTTLKTKAVQSVGQAVHWNEKLGTIAVNQSSHLTLHLYAMRKTHSENIIVGTLEIPLPSSSQTDIPFVIKGADTKHSLHHTTVYLTIVKLASSATAVTNPVEPGAGRSTGNISTVVVAAPESALRPADDPHIICVKPAPSGEEVGSEMTKEDLQVTDQALKHTQSPEGWVTATVEAATGSMEAADSAADLYATWENVVGRIKCIVDIVDKIAEVHPYAKMAWSVLSLIPRTVLNQVARDKNIRLLLQAVHDVFNLAELGDRLKTIEPDSKQVEILTAMFKHVCDCGDFIQSYAKDGQFWQRTFKNIRGHADAKIEEYRTTLFHLRDLFLYQATIKTEITTFQILNDINVITKEVQDASLDALIREIQYGDVSRFNRERGCLPGTRTAFLDHIVDWVNDPDSECALILAGQAGTGKSAIANEVACRFHDMHRLGSSFMFRRAEGSKPYLLFKTLARDLSDRYPSFKAALGKIIKDDTSLRISAQDYSTLFEFLILQPLKDLHIIGPIFIVIDALDESGDVNGRDGLHSFLADHISKLPSNFRILITSRPEKDIEDAFSRASGVRILHMDDTKLSAQTIDDIRAYINKKLRDVGISEKECSQLVKKAAGLFQWAAVACGYIRNPPRGLTRRRCMRGLLEPSSDKERVDLLDGLYKQVLEGYFTTLAVRDQFRSIIGPLLAAFEPLSIHSLTYLRQFAPVDDADDEESVSAMVEQLGSLLSNVTSPDLPIVPLHASFRDFLTDKRRSGDFYIDLNGAHHQLAVSCLDLMLHDLKFNICSLETSYLANVDIPDLESRIAKYIPSTLSYACRFWDDHLELVALDPGLIKKLGSLFEEKFLFWLEVLSLIGSLNLAIQALSALKGWLVRGNHDALQGLVDDASKFVRYFGVPIARSAPHIYLSALPFAPTSSCIASRYCGKFSNTLSLQHGRLSYWPALQMAIQTNSVSVQSISFSPDGERIVSGSLDWTIRIWDATTGEMVSGPFTGHRGSICSVVFSRDGQQILSGSEDRTFRVWDVTTREVIAGPFTTQTDDVLSVAFSRDRQRVASGSSDLTICVWNALTGEKVAGPFTGHEGGVCSIAFSRDGERIVSGSEDSTIRVWNATGEMVAGPFTGHTDRITSVAFSRDGQHIVSGSWDATIRVWDATTGEMAAGPLTGHNGGVYSVAFSRDGQRIASGSLDSTIHVWDITTGKIVAGPFSGGTDVVNVVAFSPDNQRVVSGSGDSTICVWDATMGETAAFTRDMGSVWSVAFSQDGGRILSSSDDGTIRVWDAATGEMVASPFVGHTNRIQSAAFSPNGQHIVSGSCDETIRVWDATTGRTVAGPLTEHTDRIRSVAFSQNGQHIVSGSWDETIRVWDAMTGEMIAGPFSGHMEFVLSVAFSGDDQQIVSVSESTIRVWDSRTGEMVAGPFTGPADQKIRSASFSHDSLRIVSSSTDDTIRVWDATTGEMVAGPFGGNARYAIWSVAFSQDGQQVVSGLGDGTICVWDITTGDMVAGPFFGHTGVVWSVAFSQDGRRIISGSEDSTIRMWDATTADSVVKANIASMVVNDDIAFQLTSRTIITDDGWICGPEDELLMWIPQPHRSCLRRPNIIWIAGERETRLEFSNFVHGKNWTACRTPCKPFGI